MKKWNNKLSLAFLSLGLLAITPSAASAQGWYGDSCNPCSNPCQDPCNDCCGFGGFELGADFLWWKTCVDDLDVGYSLVDDVNSLHSNRSYHYKTICPDWEPGVRVFLAKPDLWCNWVLEGSYTYIKPTQSKSFTSPADGSIYSSLSDDLTAIRVGSDLEKIHANWKATYQTFDVLLGYPLEFCQCQHFTPYFGIAGLFLDQSLNSRGNYASDSLIAADYFRTHWKSDLWAVGLKLGTAYEYALCDGFKLIANGSATIVAGEAKNHNTSSYFDNTGTPFEYTNSYHDDESCHCIPGWHLQAGALYETCWCDWELFFRVGYEFVQWYNVPNARRFFYANGENEFEARSTSPSTSEFGFNGLFLGAGVKF